MHLACGEEGAAALGGRSRNDAEISPDISSARGAGDSQGKRNRQQEQRYDQQCCRCRARVRSVNASAVGWYRSERRVRQAI